jgi:hypothetical protein
MSPTPRLLLDDHAVARLAQAEGRRSDALDALFASEV